MCRRAGWFVGDRKAQRKTKMSTAKGIIDTLKHLLDQPSPVGHCDAVSRLVASRLQAMGWQVTRKSDGAVVATLGAETAQQRPLVFAAHIDTLGAQVKAIKANGRLELVPVGSWSSRFAEGARASVHADQGPVRGTILPTKASGHAYGDDVDTQPVTWENVELRIDEKAANAGETEALGVRVGDPVSIDPQPEFHDNGFIVSRHLDDKAAIAVLLNLAESLADAESRPDRTIHLAFSASEEMGTGASQFAGFDGTDIIGLDIGVVADGHTSREDGIALCMGDSSGPYHRDLSLWIERTCQDAGIDCGRDVFRNYFSDLTAMKRAGADARMALLTFGVDASHGYERTHVDSLLALDGAIRAIIEAEAPALT